MLAGSGTGGGWGLRGSPRSLTTRHNPDPMLYYLGFGITLGVTAGLSPGPLLTLVLSETLAHGFRAGLRVAMAPLLTDIPIVALAVLVSARLSEAQALLGLVSIGGACYVLHIAWQTFREAAPESGLAGSPGERSLLRGVLTNALSPHPWLFWLGIGAPALARAAEAGRGAPLLFAGGFYTCLVGSKVLVAALASRSRSRLQGRWHARARKLLALVLAVFAAGLLVDGVRLLGGGGP